MCEITPLCHTEHIPHRNVSHASHVCVHEGRDSHRSTSYTKTVCVHATQCVCTRMCVYMRSVTRFGVPMHLPHTSFQCLDTHSFCVHKYVCVYIHTYIQKYGCTPTHLDTHRTQNLCFDTHPTQNTPNTESMSRYTSHMETHPTKNSCLETRPTQKYIPLRIYVSIHVPHRTHSTQKLCLDTHPTQNTFRTKTRFCVSIHIPHTETSHASVG